MSNKITWIKIGFIGGGNMAKAISEGIVKKGLVDYNQLYISTAHESSLVYWKDKGAHTTMKNGVVVFESHLIFIAVKPQTLKEAVSKIQSTLPDAIDEKIFVSILAGIKLADIIFNLETAKIPCRVMRVMTNTPVMVGEGCTVICRDEKCRNEDLVLVKSLLEVCGVCKEAPESLISSFGALAGSGPAFIYLIIEALADGAVKMGIPRQMAIQYAAQTAFGAAKMVLETGKHPAELKDNVCSPGGTTIEGIHALEKSGVRAALMDAVEACVKKSEELGQQKK